MCGRFALTLPPEAMRQLFGTRNVAPNFPPGWNLAPTQDVLAVRFNPDSHERSLDRLRWGLIPHWAKAPGIGAKLINARAEGIEAAKPAELGFIRISTRKDGDFVEIRVIDSGAGIPRAVRDKIFDPFFTTKEVGKGTGQGLSICRDVVVNKHGGKIFVEGSDETGTTFVVRLPAKDSA